MTKEKTLPKVTIHFAGDSGDGIQLAGSQFTNTTALAGNDLSTFPDFPAEIRAPIGTVAGVSGFQINFGSVTIDTPGGQPDVLVAMNAAAFRKNFKNLKPGGAIIVNSAGFDKRNLKLAGYPEDAAPLDSLTPEYDLYKIDITGLNREALKELKLGNRLRDQSRNMFALGFLYFMYHRDAQPTLDFLEEKFGDKPEILQANTLSLKAGRAYGETLEALSRYRIEKAQLPPGEYRNIVGNQALGLGLIAAAQKSKLELFYSGYPITPASDILHFLARHKNFGVKTFQAEDEIAAVTAAIGASFGGSLAVTATSGPGMALKAEGLGLAIMLELPLVIINVQRGGPSTGLPTKTEQADLMQALYGRNGEAPIPVLAAQSPSDCFNTAFEAARIALEYMTPVIVLSDGYIANGSEPWRFPRAEQLGAIKPAFAEAETPYKPYNRDARQVRRWAIPGTPKMNHHLGGLEKDAHSGEVSYDPANHEEMVRIRAAKVNGVAKSYAPLHLEQGPESGALLILGWGSTFGSVKVAVRRLIAQGHAVAQVHLREIAPFPENLGTLLNGFDHVLIPELNDGQMVHLIRDRYLVDAQRLNKIQGLPFLASEIEEAALKLLPQ